MVNVNKENWRAFFDVQNNILKRIDINQKRKEIAQDNMLKEKQVSAAVQIKALVSAEFIETWNSLPEEVQRALTQQKQKNRFRQQLQIQSNKPKRRMLHQLKDKPVQPNQTAIQPTILLKKSVLPKTKTFEPNEAK